MCRCRCTQTLKTVRPSDHRARARSNPTTATSWWNEQEGTCGQSPYDSHDVMPYVMSLMSGALARKSPWSISTPSLMALLVVFVVFGCTITTQSATFATLRYDITCRVCWMQEPCQRLGEYPHVPAGCAGLRRHQPVAWCRSAALPNLHCITMHTHLRLPGNDVTYTHIHTFAYQVTTPRTHTHTHLRLPGNDATYTHMHIVANQVMTSNAHIHTVAYQVPTPRTHTYTPSPTRYRRHVHTQLKRTISKALM